MTIQLTADGSATLAYRSGVVVAVHRFTVADVYRALVVRVGEVKAAGVVAGLITLGGQGRC